MRRTRLLWPSHNCGGFRADIEWGNPVARRLRPAVARHHSRYHVTGGSPWFHPLRSLRSTRLAFARSTHHRAACSAGSGRSLCARAGRRVPRCALHPGLSNETPAPQAPEMDRVARRRTPGCTRGQLCGRPSGCNWCGARLQTAPRWYMVATWANLPGLHPGSTLWPPFGLQLVRGTAAGFTPVVYGRHGKTCCRRRRRRT